MSTKPKTTQATAMTKNHGCDEAPTTKPISTTPNPTFIQKLIERKFMPKSVTRRCADSLPFDRRELHTERIDPGRDRFACRPASLQPSEQGVERMPIEPCHDRESHDQLRPA